MRTVRQIPRTIGLRISLPVSDAPSCIGTTNPSRTNKLNVMTLIFFPSVVFLIMLISNIPTEFLQTVWLQLIPCLQITISSNEYNITMLLARGFLLHIVLYATNIYKAEYTRKGVHADGIIICRHQRLSSGQPLVPVDDNEVSTNTFPMPSTIVKVRMMIFWCVWKIWPWFIHRQHINMDHLLLRPVYFSNLLNSTTADALVPCFARS